MCCVRVRACVYVCAWVWVCMFTYKTSIPVDMHDFTRNHFQRPIGSFFLWSQLRQRQLTESISGYLNTPRIQTSRSLKITFTVPSYNQTAKEK